MTNEGIDVPFRVVKGTGKFISKLSQNSSKSFFAGTKAAAKAVGKGVAIGAKATGKGFLKVGRKTTEGFVAAGKVSESARKKLYEKRALGLERRQNIATYKANIESQKQLKIQQRTVIQEAKLKQLELKAARREFLKQQRAQRVAERRAKAPLLYGKTRIGKPLSDRAKGKINLNKSNGGFFK